MTADFIALHLINRPVTRLRIRREGNSEMFIQQRITWKPFIAKLNRMDAHGELYQNKRTASHDTARRMRCLEIEIEFEVQS